MLSRLRHPARLLGGAAGLLAAFTLLACSSSEPTDPSVAPGRTDTYFFATVTLLDIEGDCDPAVNCDPEFFDCTSLEPLFRDETWSMYGDFVTAGVSTDQGAGRLIAITGSDPTSSIGVGIEFRVPDITDAGAGTELRGLPSPGNPCTSPSPGVNGVFAELDALCARLSSVLVPESRFNFDPCEPWSITLTEWEENGDGELQQAVSTGGNEFSPAGIMEGTFSFVGQNLQSTAAGDLTAHVLVEGCFRVSVPEDERGVPSNPGVASSLCTP